MSRFGGGRVGATSPIAPGTYAPIPAGTPVVGQTPVVTTVSPLALGWGSGAGLPSTVVTRTASSTAAAGQLIQADATSGAQSHALPAGAPVGGLVTVIKIDSGSNPVAVAGTINGDAGGASITAQHYGAVFEHIGANAWRVVAVTASGVDGLPGTNGTDGRTILSGSAAPTTEGANGDFYIRTGVSPSLYGPKTGGAWGSATSLLGAAGADGILSVFRDEGSAVTARAILDVQGSGATLSQDGTKMILTVPGSAGGTTPTVAPWTPSTQGWLAATFDPATCNGQVSSNSGRIEMVRIDVPTAISVTNIILWCAIAGVSLTNCFAALYDSTGARLGVTADQSAVWNSTGLKTMALVSGPIAVAAGYIYVALLQTNSSAAPSFKYRLPDSTNLLNMGLGVSASRAVANVSGQTSMPSSLTLASNVAFNSHVLVGLS